MCAVTAYTVFLIHIIRNTVHINLLFHRLMECCVKHKHLRGIGHCSSTTLYAHNMCRGVKGRVCYTLLKNRHYLVTNENRACEIGTSVDNAVTDRLNLINRADTSNLFVKKSIYNKLCCRRVVNESGFKDVLFLSACFVNDTGTFDAYTFAISLCKHLALFGVKKLILKRAGACVYN